MPNSPTSTTPPGSPKSRSPKLHPPLLLPPKTLSDRDERPGTPTTNPTPSFTPSETPPREQPNTDTLSIHDKMASPASKDSTEKETKKDAEPPQNENTNTATTKADVKGTRTSDGAMGKKMSCKKHADAKKKKKSASKKQKEESDKDSSSESDSDDSESDSDEESTESESESSSSDEDEKAAKKKKKKAKAKAKAKTKKLKSKKRRTKGKKSKSSSSSSEDSSDSDDESSEDEKAKLKARKAKLKKKAAKKAKKELGDDEDDEDDEVDTNQARAEDRLRAAQQQLAALGLNRQMVGRRRGRGGLNIGLGRGLSGDLELGNVKGQKKKDVKKKPKGSKVAFKRVDELWDNSIHNYKLTETADDPDANEWDQYIFTVRRKFDWENKYVETVVDVKSKPLRECLGKIMEGVKSVSLVEETPAVDPNMLFLYLEESRTYMKELKGLAETEKKKKARKEAATKAKHLKMLIKYLDKDYAETKKTLYPLLETGTIKFDLLWALFKPNDIAYCPTYGNPDEPRCFKIEYATKEQHFMRGGWYCIEGRYLEYDGKSFGMGNMSIDVDSFKGPRKISSLACYPLRYHKDADGLKKQLVERGKKFVALKGMNYRFHKGMAFYKRKKQVIKVNINGRIMVDPAIHRRINPNYAISTVKPKDLDVLGNSNSDSDSDCCCCESDSESEGGTNNQTTGLGDEGKEKYRLKVVKDKSGKAHIVEVEFDENGNEIPKEDLDKIETDSEERLPDFTEEELLIASSVVLGFAFSEKLWLEFTVSGITDIEWDEGAFDSLVLPDNQKTIVRALVESHTFHAAQTIDDVIQGKGKGLVAVLHGPPGTGKTLTAEGIAELLRRPLYMVSAGELGTDPRTLEAELNKILDIAHSWGSLLLLDEADVFLEKRTIHDIHRNALVSIFLRLLEYFQGILFLTTNRVETFDDAFQSRIHVALRYGELTTKAKKAVWKMFVEKVRAKEAVATAKFKESDFDALARHSLNGRQIKNSVRTAQALAVNEKEPLSMHHLTRVLDVAETFDRDLKGGTGYMDAMRSYT